MEVHSTVQNNSILPPSVKNHGVLTRADYNQLLSTAKVTVQNDVKFMLNIVIFYTTSFGAILISFSFNLLQYFTAISFREAVKFYYYIQFRFHFRFTVFHQCGPATEEYWCHGLIVTFAFTFILQLSLVLACHSLTEVLPHCRIIL